MTIKSITSDEFNPYFSRYIDLNNPDATIEQVLATSLQESVAFINAIDKPLDYRYAPEKWSIAQVILHNIDTERVFAYRALRFMRGDQTDLAGFDQDVFIEGCGDYAFAKAELLQSLTATREATMALYNNMPHEFLTRTGTANGNLMSVRVIPFLIVGHHKHHESVIKERYL